MKQHSREWLLLGILSLLNVQASIVDNEIDDGIQRIPLQPKSPAVELPGEVDILTLMNVSDKDAGVSLVQGPIHQFPAFKFRQPYGNVPLLNSSEVRSAINNFNGFTVVFVYRQQKNNMGTLLSVNSPGRLTPWFQLNSNSKTGLISLKYKLNSSEKLRQIDWVSPRQQRKSPIAAWTWLSLSMDFNSDLVRLDLDCLPSRFESIKFRNSYNGIDIPDDALVYFRQEPGRKKKFLGSMQVAKVLPYITNKRLWACYQISKDLNLGVQKPMLK
ncbi:kielin/chordin-like protein [Coccinella septempunctata]|uniref:kielin/chordin-like protein n=1 Tax=Coccinella septempunctata TaxID=41139 RepID=UPI001D0823C4|nr:kielin/chordin-like protein [Coccinella septempunctata]XP_044748451.1 kielin/chordin-like protein [Coccinella septempunctata]